MDAVGGTAKNSRWRFVLGIAVYLKLEPGSRTVKAYGLVYEGGLNITATLVVLH